MLDFEKRMVEEWKEVNDFRKSTIERAKKLNDFVNSNPSFEELGDEDKFLMQEQLYAMTNVIKMLTMYNDKLTNRCLKRKINPVNGQEFDY